MQGKVLKCNCPRNPFPNRKTGLIYVSYARPQTKIPNWKKVANKELQRHNRTFIDKKCLTLKNIPQVLASFQKAQSNDTSIKDFHLREFKEI